MKNTADNTTAKPNEPTAPATHSATQANWFVMSPELANELRQIDSDVEAERARKRQQELARLRELAKYD